MRAGPETNQLRLNLCFRDDDQLERAAYDILKSPTLNKSRSHLVAQAVTGMLFLDSQGRLDAHSIPNIIEDTVAKYAAAAPVPQAAPAAAPQQPPSQPKAEPQAKNTIEINAAQEAALASMLDLFK